MSKPEIGKRLLPHVVDEYKNRDPDKVAATFQIASGQKWHDVTYSELSNAVDYAAYYIENQLGLSNDFEMLAFLGLNDIRYTVVFLAAMKCKYTVRSVVLGRQWTALLIESIGPGFISSKLDR